MKTFKSVSIAWLLVLGLIVPAMGQTSFPSFVSGFNGDVDPLNPVFVPFFDGHWQFDADLTFDPSEPRMEKHFDTPRDATGAPILLDALQPFAFPLWENFFLQEVGTTADGRVVDGRPVSDWHEEILTPGWEWVIPGQLVNNEPFMPGESLITLNGNPWPWDFIPMFDEQGQPVQDPTKLWVEFPPIFPGEILDVHKGLLWVGTEENRVWGDDTDETFIRVIEYPTPEPTSLALMGLGGLALLKRRRGC